MRNIIVYILIFCFYKTYIYGLVRSFDPNIVNKTIALTFDDGPHSILTPRLLDILKTKNIKVTFFVMGIKVIIHPEIIKRAFDEGHEIANHVWNHPVLTKIKREDVHTQIERTSQAIQYITNKKPTTMRPPYGNTNNRLNNFIYNNDKLSVILWSFDTQDWKRPPSDTIIKNTMANIKPGGIILCHDIHPGTIAAMPVLIEKLLNEGYGFATVSEMIHIQETYHSKIKASRYLRH